MLKVYKAWNAVLTALYPQRCIACGCLALGELCAHCRAELPWLYEPACPLCSEPGVRGPCGRCQRRPPPFERCRALFHYAPPVDRMIQELKFHGRLSHAGFLGRELAEILRPLPRPDALVPVPLHPWRQGRRGYNQALEIARTLSRALGVPLAADLVRRRRYTPPQTDLPYAARLRSLRGAFAVRGPLPGGRLAVVDDVLTTGHTAGELAACLKRAGAKEVEVWVIARTGRRVAASH